MTTRWSRVHCFKMLKACFRYHNLHSSLTRCAWSGKCCLLRILIFFVLLTTYLSLSSPSSSTGDMHERLLAALKESWGWGGRPEEQRTGNSTTQCAKEVNQIGSESKFILPLSVLGFSSRFPSLNPTWWDGVLDLAFAHKGRRIGLCDARGLLRDEM